MLALFSVNVIISPVQASTNIHSTSVVGNDQNDTYIGTGGLLLPNSFTGGATQKKNVAACMECTWKYTVYCAADSSSMCAHAVVTCPSGQIRYRVWFGQTPQTIAVVGSVCWGSGTPPTRRQTESRVNDLVIRGVPNLALSCNPDSDTFTVIPVICWVNQPTQFSPAPFTLSGRNIRINATAKWHWKWGDGQSEWRSLPGKPYPSTQIDHTYRQQGHYAISVDTTWTATYTVAGIGTFDVSGDLLHQHDQGSMLVHSARSVLTSWS